MKAKEIQTLNISYDDSVLREILRREEWTPKGYKTVVSEWARTTRKLSEYFEKRKPKPEIISNSWRKKRRPPKKQKKPYYPWKIDVMLEGR